MFPQNENRNEGTFGCCPWTEDRNEGTFACSPGTNTGTRAHSPKPPFYETALLSPSEFWTILVTNLPTVLRPLLTRPFMVWERLVELQGGGEEDALPPTRTIWEDNFRNDPSLLLCGVSGLHLNPITINSVIRMSRFGITVFPRYFKAFFSPEHFIRRGNVPQNPNNLGKFCKIRPPATLCSENVASLLEIISDR